LQSLLKKRKKKAPAVLHQYLANPSLAALTTLYVPRVECFVTNCIRSTLLFYIGCSRFHFRRQKETKIFPCWRE
ncbi:hypothetical protein TRV_06268, partial [Trichophyton verrucosum HKI 0517]